MVFRSFVLCGVPKRSNALVIVASVIWCKILKIDRISKPAQIRDQRRYSLQYSIILDVREKMTNFEGTVIIIYIFYLNQYMGYMPIYIQSRCAYYNTYCSEVILWCDGGFGEMYENIHKLPQCELFYFTTYCTTNVAAL